jgi:hypothetical protein
LIAQLLGVIEFAFSAEARDELNLQPLTYQVTHIVQKMDLHRL